MAHDILIVDDLPNARVASINAFRAAMAAVDGATPLEDLSPEFEHGVTEPEEWWRLADAHTPITEAGFACASTVTSGDSSMTRLTATDRTVGI